MKKFQLGDTIGGPSSEIKIAVQGWDSFRNRRKGNGPGTSKPKNILGEVAVESQNEDKRTLELELLLNSPDPQEVEYAYFLTQGMFGQSLTDNIYRWGHPLLNINEADADDIWQMTLMTLRRIVSSGRLEVTGKLPGLLWTIASRRSYDLWRKRNRDIAKLNEYKHLEMESGEVKVWRLDNEHDMKKMLVCHMQKLPLKQKVVMEAYYRCAEQQDGLPTHKEIVKEVKAVLGHSITVNTVKKRLERARNNLRKQLAINLQSGGKYS